MDPFIGEIRLLPYTFAPQDWLPCDGRKLFVQQYQALFAILGDTYGGDLKTYFNLPNLQGFIPVGTNSTIANTVVLGLGKTTGTTTETLSYSEYPTHNHTMNGLGNGSTANRLNQPTAASRPSTLLLNGNSGSSTPVIAFSDVATPNTTFAAQAISPNGTTTAAAHSNQQPNLPLQFMIATQGVFPVRS